MWDTEREFFNKNIKKTGNESFIQVDGLFSNKTLSSPDTASTASDSSLSLSNSSSVSELQNTHAEEEKEANCEEVGNCENTAKSCLQEKDDTKGRNDFMTDEVEATKRNNVNDISETFIKEDEVISNKILVITPLRREQSLLCEKSPETIIKSDRKKTENLLQGSPFTGIKVTSSLCSFEHIGK